MPLNDHDGLFYVKDLLLTGFKPVECEHFFRSSRWYFRKYRSSTWQVHSRRA
jgi:hypothetical protein